MSSEYSSKGQMWGYIGGTTCLIFSFILITGLTLGGVSNWWALGIGSALSGVWWLAFSAYAFARLPDRPARSHSSSIPFVQSRRMKSIIFTSLHFTHQDRTSRDPPSRSSYFHKPQQPPLPDCTGINKPRV